MNPLREAAVQIKDHWHQGYYDNSDPNEFEPTNFCGLGMVNKVLAESLGLEYRGNKNDEFWEIQRKSQRIMHDLAKEQFPDRTENEANFVSFNDHPETTEDEVIAVLEKAAVIWDERFE